jgi:chromosome segregation ATPase
MEMTEHHGEDIAVLKDRVARYGKDISRSFNRIEGVENTQKKNDLLRVHDESKYDEMTAQLESLKDAVETAIGGIKSVESRIDDRLKSIEKIVADIQHDTSSTNTRVDTLEADKFDAVKVLRWLGTWRGTFFMVAISAMLIGAIFPDAREWISDLLGIITKIGP